MLSGLPTFIYLSRKCLAGRLASLMILDPVKLKVIIKHCGWLLGNTQGRVCLSTCIKPPRLSE